MDNSWERVKNFIEIDKNTADMLIKCFDPRKNVEYIEAFSGGRSTTNYRVKTRESEKEFVLRLYPKEDKRCCKEYAIYERMKGSVPIPEIYYVNDEKTIVDNDFAVIEYIEGMTLSEYIYDNNGFPGALAQEIGETLAYIHKKKFEKEGFLDENLNITEGLPPISLWYDFFLNNRAGERLGADIRSRIYRVLRKNDDLLGLMTKNFVFSHGDFRPSNIMVKDGKLAGIFDWENALSAPDYFDIGQFIRYEEQISEQNEKSFIYGYNKISENPVHENWKKISKLMDLANILSLLNNEEEKQNLFMDMKNLIQRTIDILK